MPGPKPQGGKALTAAERQARYRARLKADAAAPRIRFRKPADRRSRPQRWHYTVAELVKLQADYQEWLNGLPESFQGTPTVDALQAICGIYLSDLEAIEPPQGFGRD